LQRQPNASVFHARAWLRALQRVYHFQPVAVTESLPGAPLQNAIVFCKVSSWLTGKRLVSLPFSDHCDPLVSRPEELAHLLSFAATTAARESCRYTEIRPTASAVERPFLPAATYYLHQLDLTPGPGALYANLHRDCIQRRIRRSQREKLTFAQGNSEQLLKDFYRLHIHMRLGLGLPPQPLAWFEALLAEFAENVTVRVAFSQGQAVASIVTLEFKDTTVYKYGCSDERQNRLGGAQALMWAAIEEACNKGHTVFDMGRSDSNQTGLIEYKDRWGGRKKLITYYRHPGHATQPGFVSRPTALARRAFSRMPVALAPWVGRLVYRHLA
jgi:CelD/BcsL family acetyltransferase involved in cellulose biosynthesis